MPAINVFGSSGEPTRTLVAPLIYTAPAWTGPWSFQDRAIFRSAVVYSASEGTDRLEIELPYGSVESGGTFETVAAANLVGSWVRLDLLDRDGSVSTFFVGKIYGEDRETFGSDPDDGTDTPRPKGFQVFVGLGGIHLLELAAVSTSWFNAPPKAGAATQGHDVVQVGWTPGFNQRDPQGLLRGNRSSSPAGDDGSTYTFGGTDVWTRRQAIGYLLKRFANKAGAPPFALGGQLDVLDEDLRLLEIGVTSTVRRVLGQVIAHREGIEFGVRPVFAGTDLTGFEVNVFTLTAEPITFRGCTIPANPNTISFSTSDMQDVQSLKTSTDRSHSASRIRIVGDRVVVCGTLRGPILSGESSGDILTSTYASLVGKWSASLEADYKRGDPAFSKKDDGELHDVARKAERFIPVYQLYGFPAGRPRESSWLPSVDGNGNPNGATANYQDAVRETQSQLPLLHGWDYSVIPPVRQNTATEFPEFKAPFVICEDRKTQRARETTPGGGGTTSSTHVYSLAESLGLGHSVLKHDLGILLHASPHHRLAWGRAVFDGNTDATSEFPWSEDLNEAQDEGHAVDARTLAATLSWKTDVRLALEHVIDAANDEGTVIEVAAPDMQFWWLAGGTILDLDASGQPIKSPAEGQVLRNDADIFAPQMAGLIARYTIARARVEITFAGWRPWLGLLGSVLTTVEEGGQTSGVNAPITSIEIRGGRNNSQPQTIVRAGFK